MVFITLFEAIAISHIVSLSLIALFTSALTSLVGAGGGTILLLSMLYLLPTPSVIPVHGCIQLISNSTRVYLFWKYMQWGIIFRFVALMPVGVYLGLLFYNALQPEHLQLVIAGAILLSLFIAPKGLQAQKSGKSVFYIVGMIAGFGNMIVGVLSPLLAAVLRLQDLPKEQTVGTLGFFGFAGNLFKITGFAFIGFSFIAYLPLLIPASAASVLGGIIGKKLLKRTSHKGFHYAFQAVIFLLSINLILDVFM